MKLVICVLVGGVIGWITNLLAIIMVFRPHEAKYIRGHKLPFTPGLIPKEKERIAESIGDAIGNNLMNEDVMSRELLSDEMVERIHKSVSRFMHKLQQDESTVREFAMRYFTEDEIDKATNGVKKELSTRIESKMRDQSLATTIAVAVTDHAIGRLRGEGVGLFGPLRSSMAEAVRTPLQNYLTQNVHAILCDHGAEIVDGLLTSQIDEYANRRMCDMLKGGDERIESVCNTVVSMYRKLIKDRLPQILASIDIPQIVEKRINEMPIAETERILLSVMDKELKAIVWLGAVLGAIMGSVTAFID